MNKKIIPLLLLFFLTILGYSISSSFVSLYLKQTGTSELNIGFIFSLWPLFVILFAPFAGKLSDKIGRKWLLVLSSAGYASFGFLAGFQQFIPAFIILGISNAFLWTIGRAYVFDIGKGTKSREIAYFNVSAVMGSLFGAPLSGKLVETISFVPTFYAGGLVTLAGCLIAALFLKEAGKGIEKNHKFKFSADFAALGFSTILISFVAVALPIFFPILLSSLGFAPFVIGLLFAAFKLSSAISLIVGSRIYNLFAEKITMISGSGTMSIGLLITGIAVSLPEFFLASVLGGIGIAVSDVARQSFLGKMTKSFGTSSGIYESFVNVGQWLGTWASGLVAASFGIRNLFIFSAVLSLIAGLSFLLTKNNKRRNPKTKNKK